MKRDGHYTGIDSSIPLFEENSRVLKLPRGLYGIITGLFDSLKIQYIIEDHRISKTNLTATFTKKLKPYQEEFDRILQTDPFYTETVRKALDTAWTYYYD